MESKKGKSGKPQKAVRVKGSKKSGSLQLEVSIDGAPLVWHKAKPEEAAESETKGKTRCPKKMRAAVGPKQRKVHQPRPISKEQECWYEVLQLPKLQQEGAEVNVKGSKLHIEGTAKSGKDGQEGSKVEKLVDIPPGVLKNTVRSAWLNSNRLFVFGLKKPADKGKNAGMEPEHKDSQDSGNRQECWFQVVHMAGFKQDQVKVEVKGKQVSVCGLEEQGNKVEGHVDKHESVRVVTVPDDVARPTVRTAWLTNNKLCVFALKKKQKKGKLPADEKAMVEKTHEASDTDSDIEVLNAEEAEVLDKESLLEELALVSAMSTSHLEDAGLGDMQGYSDDAKELDKDDYDDEDDDWIRPEDTTGASNVSLSSPTPSGFHVEVCVSGYEPEEVSVRVLEDALEVTGHHQEGSGRDLIEYHFRRMFPLSEDIDAALLKCSLNRDEMVLAVSAPSKQREVSAGRSLKINHL